MERPDNSTLEQVKRAFDAVCMDVATHPFFGAVIHALMLRIAVAAAVVRRPVVGIEVFCIWGAGLADETVESLAVVSFRNLHPNRAAALKRGQNHVFIAAAAASNMLTLAADIGFVYFYCAAQQLEGLLRSWPCEYDDRDTKRSCALSRACASSGWHLCLFLLRPSAGWPGTTSVAVGVSHERWFPLLQRSDSGMNRSRIASASRCARSVLAAPKACYTIGPAETF